MDRHELPLDWGEGDQDRAVLPIAWGVGCHPRIVESDHGWGDPPAAIPCRIEWVEWLVSQQVRMSHEEVRRLAWRNLATLVAHTGTFGLLPPRPAALLPEA